MPALSDLIPARFCTWAALIAAVIGPAVTLAAPIHVRVNTVGGYVIGNPPSYHLAFANIQLDLRWNPDELTPIPRKQPSTGRITAWPVTNTSVTMTVQGTGNYDGVFPGTIKNPASSVWVLVDDYPESGDAIFLPPVSFPYLGNSVEFSITRARFDASFFSGAGDIYPQPYTTTEATWDAPRYTYNLTGVTQGAFTTGYAVAVPEPALLSISGAVIPTAFWLRRRSNSLANG